MKKGIILYVKEYIISKDKYCGVVFQWPYNGFKEVDLHCDKTDDNDHRKVIISALEKVGVEIEYYGYSYDSQVVVIDSKYQSILNELFGITRSIKSKLSLI